MILWINGAFGAGKTVTAFELHRRLPGSFVYDPENIGYFMWKNSPPRMRRNGDFQDIPLWREFNRAMLRHLDSNHPGILIVPMTLCDPVYFEEIIGGLREDGVDVRHLLLGTTEGTLLKRLRSRGDGAGSWAAQQIRRCLVGFEEIPFDARIPTDGMEIREVVEDIAERAGIRLSSDPWGGMRRFAYRIATQLKHIRI